MMPDLVNIADRAPSPAAAGGSRRSSARPGRTVRYFDGTVSRLWLNTSGRAATTVSTAPSLRRKSGVSTSIVVGGVAARIARITCGEMPRAAVVEIVAIDRGDDHVAEAELRDRLGDMLRLVARRARRAGRSSRCRTRRRACTCRP